MYGANSTLKVDLYLDNVTDLVLTLNEWWLPSVVMTIKMYVWMANSTEFVYLATGQGSFDLYFAVNIKNFLLSLSMIVVV